MVRTVMELYCKRTIQCSGVSDPVHPIEEGYAALADSVKQFCHNIVAGARAAASEAASKAATPKPRLAARPKPVRREGWVTG
jgi:hypothetical protein